MKVWTIAAVNVRRFVRDRTNLFFAFVFPIALVLIIGLQFGSGSEESRIGVTVAGDADDSDLADLVVAELSEMSDVEVERVEDRDKLIDDVEGAVLDAGLVIPAGFAESLASGDPTDLGFVARRDGIGPQLRAVVDDALSAVLMEPTAIRAAVERGADPEVAAASAERLVDQLEPIVVRSVTTGEELFPEGTRGFDVAAPSQLVLFMFTTGLSGVAALILTRKLGVSARMLSTPTSARTVITGEALGRLAIGITQGLYIVALAALLFGVGWGDPIGAMAVLLAFAAVSAGAAMLLGTLVDNEEAASGLGIVFSLALAALGGAMLPIELFGDTLASVARLTPHYWAIDAFAQLVRHDASVLDLGVQLGVLSMFAALLLALASWRMRRALTA